MTRDEQLVGYVQPGVEQKKRGALGTVAQTIGTALGRFAKKAGFRKSASSKAPRNSSTNTTSRRKLHVKNKAGKRTPNASRTKTRKKVRHSA